MTTRIIKYHDSEFSTEKHQENSCKARLHTILKKKLLMQKILLNTKKVLDLKTKAVAQQWFD